MNEITNNQKETSDKDLEGIYYTLFITIQDALWNCGPAAIINTMADHCEHISFKYKEINNTKQSEAWANITKILEQCADDISSILKSDVYT